MNQSRVTTKRVLVSIEDVAPDNCAELKKQFPDLEFKTGVVERTYIYRRVLKTSTRGKHSESTRTEHPFSWTSIRLTNGKLLETNIPIDNRISSNLNAGDVVTMVKLRDLSLTMQCIDEEDEEIVGDDLTYSFVIHDKGEFIHNYLLPTLTPPTHFILEYLGKSVLWGGISLVTLFFATDLEHELRVQYSMLVAGLVFVKGLVFNSYKEDKAEYHKDVKARAALLEEMEHLGQVSAIQLYNTVNVQPVSEPQIYSIPGPSESYSKQEENTPQVDLAEHVQPVEMRLAQLVEQKLDILNQFHQSAVCEYKQKYLISSDKLSECKLNYELLQVVGRGTEVSKQTTQTMSSHYRKTTYGDGTSEVRIGSHKSTNTEANIEGQVVFLDRKGNFRSRPVAENRLKHLDINDYILNISVRTSGSENLSETMFYNLTSNRDNVNDFTERLDKLSPIVTSLGVITGVSALGLVFSGAWAGAAFLTGAFAASVWCTKCLNRKSSLNSKEQCLVTAFEPFYALKHKRDEQLTKLKTLDAEILALQSYQP